MGEDLKISEQLPMCQIAVCCDNGLVIAGSLYSRGGEKFKHMNGDLHLISSRTFLGLCGNEGDCSRLLEHVKLRKELYENNENREMVPEVIAIVISNFLYEHRFGSYSVEAMIVSLHPKTSKPYICNIDPIGGINVRNDFVAIGGLNEMDRNYLSTIHREENDIVKAFSEAVISCEREIIKKNLATLKYNKNDVLAENIKAMRYGVSLIIIESNGIKKKDTYEKIESVRSNSRDPRNRGSNE
ncbi:proteasome subunit beta type-3-like [Zeugodacus cucurbitae]|uniref:proteasome subunit beta type-3-like n=1 Tax=Zeugodacus cucurbitae TaxID=28588 RepID=UPI0005968B53|nr:proteasome subunit beta type-3-like [Zeugodacus cucurbitae]